MVFSSVTCLLFLVMLAGSLVIQSTENTCCGNIPTYRVVLTGSMAEKHEKNSYLWKNDLNDQLQTFDLIRTEKLPAASELRLYDIVVYEVDNILLVHRIVGIEEPNATHPNERYFLLQGDAVEAPDRFPVRYEQMRAIYVGERIPFIGSFILFMQSPAGWLCTLLIVVSIIASPILDRILQKARDERFALISSEEDGEEDKPEEDPKEKNENEAEEKAKEVILP
jgi:signal peptidase